MRNRLLRDGYFILAACFGALRTLQIEPWDDSVDAFAYWATRGGDLYAGAAAGQIGAYLYSPAFAQALAPMMLLPWPVFAGLFTALNFAVLWWLAGRFALPLLLFLPIPLEIVSGNVHLLIAAAIVAGFRWAPAWAFVILTKVTPGIGLVWFLARREWRSLVLALGATFAIVSLSFVLDRASWESWLALLIRDAGSSAAGGPSVTPGWFVPVPLAVRLVVAAAVIAFAARTDRAWLLPVGVTLALPILWLNGLAILAA
nr:DUF2029 domain-containing protein [Chloroflexota bacterium]